MDSTGLRRPLGVWAHAAKSSPLVRQLPVSRPGLSPSPPERHPIRASSRMAEAPPRPVPGYELVRPGRPLAVSGPLSADEIESFYEDGYVVVPGLVTGELLDRARDAATAVEDSFGTKQYAGLGWYLWKQAPVFRELAVSSGMAAAAAQLMPSPVGDARGREMCVLRDGYFRLVGDNQGCNFHVDDSGFWPSPRDEPHGPGVNVWLALDPVGEDRGGLAVARRSHTHLYLDCRAAIAGSPAKTCSMHELAPEKAARLEAVKVCPQMAPGDAIMLTRFCFHRGDPFVAGSEGAAGPGISRYSVRYMPGEAVVEGFELVDGKFVKEDPVQLKDANPQKYPAWEGPPSP